MPRQLTVAAIVPPQAQVVDAPNLPEAEASYVINADGIGDYKVGCGAEKHGGLPVPCSGQVTAGARLLLRSRMWPHLPATLGAVPQD